MTLEETAGSALLRRFVDDFMIRRAQHDDAPRDP